MWRTGAMLDLLASTSALIALTLASFMPLPGRINSTGHGGIDAAFEAGFEKVKVNTVLMRDVNHHQLDTFLNWIQHRPIQLRFIELMETGEGSELFRKHHISGQVLRDELLRRGWIHQLRQRSDGPAQVFCHPDYAGDWPYHAV